MTRTNSAGAALVLVLLLAGCAPLVKQRVKETRVLDYGTRVRELIGYRVTDPAR